MEGLEDRLLKHACIIKFLGDFASQPAPADCSSLDLSVSGRDGLGYLLQDLGVEAMSLYHDVEKKLMENRNAIRKGLT